MEENKQNNEKEEQKKGFLESSSILDKIISSKEDQEKQKFNPNEAIGQLLKQLTSKEADVIKRRFGLNGQKRETLEVVGKFYQVTRERIRQIEGLAIKKIRQNRAFDNLIKPVEHVLLTTLNQHGGIAEEEYLLSQLFIGNGASDKKATLFILSELLNKRFIKTASNDKYKKSWRTNLIAMSFVDACIEELIKIITAEEKPLTIEDVYQKFTQTDFYSIHKDKLDDKIIESYLEISQAVARNPFNEYGLKTWGSVMPRRMNDKIYLVLKKEGKPMHFIDIAKKITQIFKKKAYPPTVHNELILNKKYVLVGRGIYALKEWGYKKGVVADVLKKILQDNIEPLSKDELVKRVLQQRIVKKNTIYLALTNKKRFKKLPNGKYTLAEENK